MKEFVAMFDDREPAMTKKAKPNFQKMGQISVSKNCLVGTILNAMESLKGAIETYESSGGSGSIFVNDGMPSHSPFLC